MSDDEVSLESLLANPELEMVIVKEPTGTRANGCKLCATRVTLMSSTRVVFRLKPIEEP